MSGFALPPAEPPTESVRSLLELLGSAREHLLDAQRQAAMIDAARNDVETLTTTSVVYFGIERRVAKNRVVLWTREVRRLEARGRAIGLAL